MNQQNPKPPYEPDFGDLYDLDETGTHSIPTPGDYPGGEDCTCLPDLPDGRINGGRGVPCPVCLARHYDNAIPFLF